MYMYWPNIELISSIDFPFPHTDAFWCLCCKQILKHCDKTSSWQLWTRQGKNWNISINESIIIALNNIVGKGEIAHFEQFPLLPQCFPKSSPAEMSESVCMWERVNIFPLSEAYWCISSRRDLKTVWSTKWQIAPNENFFLLVHCYQTLFKKYTFI